MSITLRRLLVALVAVVALVGGATQASAMLFMAHGGYHRHGVSTDSIKSQVLAYQRDLCPETDARLTKDHVAVNMHDKDPFRATGVHGQVSEMTFAEVHALTLSDGQHPPSLARSMKVAANHGHKCLIVEMKDTDWTPQDYRDIQHRAVQLGIAKTFRFYISRTSSLEMANNNAPKIKAVWKCLRETTPSEVRQLGIEGIVPRGGRLFRPFIDSMHNVGVPVYAGVNASNELDEWQRLHRLHINGTINNDPVATKRWFNTH